MRNRRTSSLRPNSQKLTLRATTLAFACLASLLSAFEVSAQRPELVVQTGHQHVNALAFSPVDKIIASGGEQALKLWDVESGRELKTFSGCLSLVKTVAFTKDGTKVVGGCTDAITVWDVRSGTMLHRLRGPFLGLDSSFALHPTGETVAVVGKDNNIFLREIATERDVRSFKGHTAHIYLLQFNADGSVLASGDKEGSVWLWDVASGRELNHLQLDSYVTALAFSADGKTLATSAGVRPIKLWDVATGKELRTLTEAGTSVQSIAFSPDGKLMAAVGYDQIFLFEAETGRFVKKLMDLSEIDPGLQRVAFSPQGDVIGAGGSWGPIILWDVKSGTPLRTLKGLTARVMSVAFDPGELLASGHSDGTIMLWDTAGDGENNMLNSPNFPEAAHALAFTSDGKSLGVGFLRGTINKLEPSTGRTNGRGSSTYYTPHALMFGPGGRTLATSASNFAISLVNLTTGKVLRERNGRGYADGNSAAAFTSDLKYFALAEDGRTIILWDFKRLQKLRTVAVSPIENIRSMAFSRDGKTLATGSGEGTVTLLDVASGKERRRFTAHTSTVDSVSFSHDGLFLASGGGDGKVKIWDVSTGEEICTLVALEGGDWVVAAPDGRFDSNNLDNAQGVQWLLPGALLEPASFEIFLRDNYEPALLHRLMKCTREKSCSKEFRPTRDLTKINRTQPVVLIKSVEPIKNSDNVQVTVEAANVQSKDQRDSNRQFLQSGVNDLRLFRDRQLVGYAPEADGPVALDSSGKFTKAFTVRLPKNVDADQYEFTAYAYNSEGVKSKTALHIYKLPKKKEPLGSYRRPPEVKGRAYVVAIGVSANEQDEYRLNYAANDARSMLSVLTHRLSLAEDGVDVGDWHLVDSDPLSWNKYDDVVPIPLISDYHRGPKDGAKKALIKAVFDLLAGRREQVPKELLREIPEERRILQARPEDTIIITYAGHGYTDDDGIFYLIPYDSGRVSADARPPNGISSEELGLWLRDVDAGEMTLIIDACYSAAAIRREDFKPGPLNNRGLGQLSYYKGMRILAASQANNVALEWRRLRHGLLTYALVKDGILRRRADYRPADYELLMSEWLSYGVKHVPEIYSDVKSGSKRLLVGRKVALGKLAKEKANILRSQRPQLFDFARSRKEFILFQLPGPPASSKLH
jgi:WD40 repeat protein